MGEVPGGGGSARKLLRQILPLAERARPSAEFFRGWVHRKRTVVLDFTVHGAPVSFDLCPGERTGDWRIEVFARKPVDGPQLARLNLERVGRRRFLVAHVPGLAGPALSQSMIDHCHRVLDDLSMVGPHAPARRLLRALDLRDPLVVVDVGANPLEIPAYSRLLGLGMCHVVGFEPQPEAFELLKSKESARETYLPYAIGDPGTHDLRVFEGSGFASMLDIDHTSIDLIGDDRWRELTSLRESIAVRCTALDDVPDLPALDLLKIDIQGGELAVFRSAHRSLASALCVVPEVNFFPIYRDQPSFADIHQELVGQGFTLHKFLFQKSVHLHGSQSRTTGRTRSDNARNQLLDGDAVYLRDLRRLSTFGTDQVKKLVLLATFVFDSSDVAVLAIDELIRRSAVPPDLSRWYVSRRYV